MSDKSKGLKILIGILIFCVISLSGYIVYYKFFDNSNATNQADNEDKNDNNEEKYNNDDKEAEDKDKLLQCEISFDGKKYKYYVVTKYEENILKITNDKGNVVYTSKFSDSFVIFDDYDNEHMNCDDLKLSMTKLNSSDKNIVYFTMQFNMSGPNNVYYIKDNKFIRLLDLTELVLSDSNIFEFYNKKTNEKVDSVRIQNGDLYAIISVDNSVIEYKYVFKDGNYSREKVSTNAYTYDKEMYPDM